MFSIDKKYSKMLDEIKKWYDSEVKEGHSVEMRIKARNNEIVGFEYIKNKPLVS